jgi:hypothetical protein
MAKTWDKGHLSWILRDEYSLHLWLKMSEEMWRASPQKMEPNGPELQPAEIIFIFYKKDPRDPVTALEWWYGIVWYGIVWYGMVWYGMVRYGMRWNGMVWYGMVWYEVEWYVGSIPWYDGIGMRVIPLWNGVPSRFANSKNWITS